MGRIPDEQAPEIWSPALNISNTTELYTYNA